MVHDNYSILILLISIGVLLLMKKLTHLACGSIKNPTIAVFFLWWYIIEVFIGAVMFNVLYFEYYENIGSYQRTDLLFEMWLMVMAAAILMPVGMMYANRIWHYNPSITVEWHTAKAGVETSQYAKSSFFLFGLFLLCLMAFFFCIQFMNSLDNIPIFSVLAGVEGSELKQMRSDATNNFVGRYYVYNFFMKSLLPVLFMICFFMRKETYYFKYLCYFLVIVNFFIAIVSLEKASIIQFILMITVCVYYEYKRIRLSLLIYVTAVMGSLILLMYVFFMSVSPEDGFLKLLLLPFQRVCLTQISGLEWYLLFVEKYGYLLGATFPNPGGFLPFEWRRITVEIMDMVHPEISVLGITGTIPVVYFGEMYINFGIMGALLSMMGMGFLIQTLDIFFIDRLKKKNDLLLLIFYIYMIFYIKVFTGNFASGIFVDEKWILVAILLYILKYFSKMRVTMGGK